MRKKNVLVTGASRGIGSAIAQHLQDGDWNVWRASREGPEYDGQRRFSVDLADVKKVHDTFQQMKKNRVKFDAVVNNAGVNHMQALGEGDSWVDGYDTILTNVMGYFNVVEAILRFQLWRPSLRIVNITSVAGRIPMTNSSYYCASNGAREMATLAMARELYPKHGILVFGVRPGRIGDTEMSDKVDKLVAKQRVWTDEEVKRHQLQYIPFRQYGERSDVSQVVCWLLEEAPAFMLGSIIEVAGGQR